MWAEIFLTELIINMLTRINDNVAYRIKKAGDKIWYFQPLASSGKKLIYWLHIMLAKTESLESELSLH